MNMNLSLANQALYLIGQAPLTQEDREQDTSLWKKVKLFYLKTMLEGLNLKAWTSPQRRRILTPTRRMLKPNIDYKYTFDLPIDFAKPLRASGSGEREGSSWDYNQADYRIEGLVLQCRYDTVNLLYVSNGKRVVDFNEVPTATGFNEAFENYINGGDAKTMHRLMPGDNGIHGPDAKWFKAHTQGQKIVPPPGKYADEDYPEYEEVPFEPLFYQYWKNILAAELSIPISDKPELYNQFYSIAQRAVEEAEAATKDMAAASRKPAPTWQEKLGLTATPRWSRSGRW
jgi:hypothetical protein